MKEIYNDIGKAAELLFQRDYSEAFGGNISVRADASEMNMLECCRDFKPVELEIETDLNPLNNDIIIITTTGSRMYQVQENPKEHTTVIFIEQGNAFLMKDKKPSSELKCHIAIYSVCRDMNSIIHTHPPASTAVSNMYQKEKDISRALKKAHGEFDIIFNKGIGYIDFEEPGSSALALRIMDSFKEYSVALMQKHGVIAAGKDIFTAFDKIDIIEKCASIHILGNKTAI